MIIEKIKVDKNALGLTNFSAKIYACLVTVDASESIADVMREIADKSWISRLGIVQQIAFEARLQSTVKVIMENCLSFCSDTTVGKYDYSVVGEYIISKEGRRALVSSFNHSAVPLAELWKEKESGNAGFDFHSESTSNLIIYGEAKYDSNQNPYNRAINQVEGFINQKKDAMELTDLSNFVSDIAVRNFISNKKGFCVSFSITTQKPIDIIKKAIQSDKINNIKSFDEFYVVGVVINDK